MRIKGANTPPDPKECPQISMHSAGPPPLTHGDMAAGHRHHLHGAAHAHAAVHHGQRALGCQSTAARRLQRLVVCCRAFRCTAGRSRRTRRRRHLRLCRWSGTLLSCCVVPLCCHLCGLLLLLCAAAALVVAAGCCLTCRLPPSFASCCLLFSCCCCCCCCCCCACRSTCRSRGSGVTLGRTASRCVFQALNGVVHPPLHLFSIHLVLAICSQEGRRASGTSPCGGSVMRRVAGRKRCMTHVQAALAQTQAACGEPHHHSHLFS